MNNTTNTSVDRDDPSGRRRFLRAAAAGGGALALTHAFAVRPAAASGQGEMIYGDSQDAVAFTTTLESRSTRATLALENYLEDTAGNVLNASITESTNRGAVAQLMTNGSTGWCIYAGSLSTTGYATTAELYTLGLGTVLKVVSNNVNNDEAAATFRHDGEGRVAEFAKTESDSSAVVYAETPGTGSAIDARSTDGRGGLFRGGKAQIRLYPSTDASPPSSGQRGDLFVDSSGRLWFAKGTSNWIQLA